MNDIPIPVQQYVSIMPIFHLQEVRHQTVSREGLNEVLFGLWFVWEVGVKELLQGHTFFIEVFEQRIKGSDILQHLNEAIIGS